eukprot:582283-Pelagomonas_calceolata.AAC.1
MLDSRMSRLGLRSWAQADVDSQWSCCMHLRIDPDFRHKLQRSCSPEFSILRICRQRPSLARNPACTVKVRIGLQPMDCMNFKPKNEWCWNYEAFNLNEKKGRV